MQKGKLEIVRAWRSTRNLYIDWATAGKITTLSIGFCKKSLSSSSASLLQFLVRPKRVEGVVPLLVVVVVVKMGKAYVLFIAKYLFAKA